MMMMNAINHDQEMNKVITIERNIEARNNDECQEKEVMMMMNAINHDQEINKVITIERNIEARNNDECQEPGCAKGTKEKKKTLDYKQGSTTRRPTR